MSDPFRPVRRPCASPYACGRRVQTQAKVRRPMCRDCRRKLRNLKSSRYRDRLMNQITVVFRSRAAYDAAMAAVAEKVTERAPEIGGDTVPTIRALDAQDALADLEAAR